MTLVNHIAVAPISTNGGHASNGATKKAIVPTSLPSHHRIVQGDARDLAFLPDASVHLVVTSPPYFDLKQYASDSSSQLGDMHDYEAFLAELDRVWAECRRVLVPGGRVCCVVGAVTIARRKAGRHYVLPLPSDIQVRSRQFGLDNLTPIIWLKVSNIVLEASNSSRFLGKPNLPNGVVKNDFETIVMLRKPGGHRNPTPEMEAASRIENDDNFRWFVPIWSDITGASTKSHPAPYPVELAYRLIRMFSFAGDTVLDPFLGSGTTIEAAILAGRNSVGVETEPSYVTVAEKRLAKLPFGVTLNAEAAMKLTPWRNCFNTGLMHSVNALDRFVDWFRTFRFTDRNDRLPPGLELQYHSRSDAHSQKLGELIVADLIDACPAIRAQADQGEIAYGINHVFVWPNGKAKTLDLAIGIPLVVREPPAGIPIHRLETQTRNRKTPTQSLRRLLIAVEEKTVMTEHGKSQPRVYSELNDSHTIVHQGSRDTIAAGITAVNIAANFVSPLRQTRERRVEYSLHDQPKVTANMVAHLRKLPIRQTTNEVGFDAYCAFVLDLDNQGRVNLHTEPPSPRPGNFDHYTTFLERICHFYSERYHDLQSLPDAAGLSIEESLIRKVRTIHELLRPKPCGS